MITTQCRKNVEAAESFYTKISVVLWKPKKSPCFVFSLQALIIHMDSSQSWKSGILLTNLTMPNRNVNGPSITRTCPKKPDVALFFYQVGIHNQLQLIYIYFQV